MKVLYQIENSKSGRRLIYKGFDKFEWSPGNGEDGTFFEEEKMDFILSLIPEHQKSEISIIRYEIRTFDEWPIVFKHYENETETYDGVDLI